MILIPNNYAIGKGVVKIKIKKMENAFKDIINTIGKLDQLQKQIIKEKMPYFKTSVAEIIKDKIEDAKPIEQLLDQLLDLAFDEEVLLQLKKLCRYYFKIDSVATVSYIKGYREMWDNEEPNDRKS